MASVIRIATHFNIDLEFRLAPFGRRLLAWALDLLLQVFYLLVATRFMRRIMNGIDPSSENDYNLWAIVLILLLPFFLYHFVCEVLMQGQSAGKRITGIRVVSSSGGQPGISQLIIRWLVRTSDYTILLLILSTPYNTMFGSGFLTAVGASVLLLFGDLVLVNALPKHQRLGDVLAHTLVITVKQAGRLSDTLFLPVKEDYVPVFPAVMRLSDRDINSLKGLLNTANQRHDYALADRAGGKVKNYLGIETEMSAFDFLETLLKDYNYLSGQ